MVSNLAPNERYAIVGKTRSGKTRLAMVIAGTFAQALKAPWEVWWIDTKNDPNDLKALRAWGFRNAVSAEDKKGTGGLPNAYYFKVVEQEGVQDSVIDQVQQIIDDAYKRHNVLLVIDEYAHVTPTTVNAGRALLNVFQRGGGVNVGIIGLTQEPVYVPRQLLSQATHLVLFSVTFQADIDYLRKMYKAYVPPLEAGYPHGFYWRWIDGAGAWDFYPDQMQWYENLNVALPRNK